MISNLRRQYHLRILNYLLANILWRLRFRFGWISGGGGDSHAHLSPEESVKHIERVFQWYSLYGGDEIFKGSCVEIGPGDSAGVAMLMRHHGAEKVTLVDRFRSPKKQAHQEKIYKLIADRHKLYYLKGGIEWNDESIKGIQWHIGLSAEAFFQKAVEQRQSFDAIVSCAAMEHLFDPLGCLTNMIKSLKTGGTMVHCIDFRDHGMFEPRYHPLKFLSVPSYFYWHMTRNSGDQNRVLLQEYRRTLQEISRSSAISFDFFVWILVGGVELDPFLPIDRVPPDLWDRSSAIVEQWRHELATEFKGIHSRDLAVAGVCLSLTKRSE